jgi:hypothetical protein
VQQFFPSAKANGNSKINDDECHDGERKRHPTAALMQDKKGWRLH